MDGSSPNSLSRIRTACLVIVAVGVVVAGLYVFSAALIPFVIAALFHFSLASVYDMQRCRWNFPRWVAVITTTLVGLIVFFGLWAATIAAVAQLAASLPGYIEQSVEFIDRSIEHLPLGVFGMTTEEARAAMTANSGEGARDFIADTVVIGIDIVSSGVLVLIFLAFMLLGKAFGKGRPSKLISEFESSVQKYLIAKFVISAGAGLIIGSIFALLGVEFAIAFGLLAFLMNFIPNIGSVVATLLPIPILLLGDYSLTTVILALSLVAAVEFSVGNFIEPKVMGKSLGLHPVVVLLGLVVFGVVWGIPGMFLVPRCFMWIWLGRVVG